ncbi:2-amino-4-hydroxy-6-hydroxymethyldihydropteridinediphosphokinase [soil metagenome]
MTDSRARAYVSLGTNLGDRTRNLGDARARLMTAEGVRLISLSAAIETPPVDVLDQPDFLNQVAGIDTTLPPRGLLETCLSIEIALGRDRATTARRGPRVIDLDILLFGGEEIALEGLKVPHARLAERTFLLDLCREAGAPAGWLPSPAAAPRDREEVNRSWP